MSWRTRRKAPNSTPSLGFEAPVFGGIATPGYMETWRLHRYLTRAKTVVRADFELGSGVDGIRYLSKLLPYLGDTYPKFLLVNDRRDPATNTAIAPLPLRQSFQINPAHPNLPLVIEPIRVEESFSETDLAVMGYILALGCLAIPAGFNPH